MARTVYPLKLYIKQPVILILVLLSSIINLFIWFWLFWYIGPQETDIFLHYNILFGVDFIGPWWKILYMPVSGLFILSINFLLGWLIFHKDKFAAYILNFITAFCHIFLLITTFLLVFLNV